MPYLPSDAAKKSRLYNNIINGDTIEYQNEIEDLKKKQQISGSVNANSPLRDEDGILVSFESETAGVSLEESFEEVRLENKQFFFTGQLDNEFTHYFQPITTDDTTDTTTTTNGPDISTDLLHNKLLQFFDENRSKGNNAQGWKEFTSQNLHLRHAKKRKAAGISGKRYKSIKKDLKNFMYDEVIENHLYRTPQGQRIWLRLGFPYIEDKSKKDA